MVSINTNGDIKQTDFSILEFPYDFCYYQIVQCLPDPLVRVVGYDCVLLVRGVETPCKGAKREMSV